MGDAPKEYSSPACTLHEWQEGDSSIAADIASWRRKERQRLLGLRADLEPAARRQLADALGQKLCAVLAELYPDNNACVAVYWPIRDEPDLRISYTSLARSGFALCLPVVVEKNRPLEFHSWQPGDPLVPDRLGIPAPGNGVTARPDIIVAPFVGVDQHGFRLGNGGGYYDRTLAALSPRPRMLSIGYANGELRSIYPQEHDLPADWVITETAIRRIGDSP